MRISLYGGSDAATVDQLVDKVRAAADEGFGSIWFPQTPALDSLTALAVAGREVAGIGLGTAVVPIQGRHPQSQMQAMWHPGHVQPLVESLLAHLRDSVRRLGQQP